MNRLRETPRLRQIGTALALAVALTASGPAGAAPTGLDHPLVVTQRPRPAPGRPATPRGLVRQDAFDGTRLLLLSPDGQTRVLSAGFESACDPDVSFDGQRLLFAGRKDAAARWRIYEMGLDGQGLRAVSPEHLDARSPIHTSALFTLDSPEPWPTTIFVGQEPTLTETGASAASSLYNVKLDGTELRRLTYNPNRNLDPFQMWDGRVLYAGERHPNQPGARDGRVSLYALHMEGADMERFGGERARRIQQMPCATAGGLVVFVESDHATSDGAGQLACVTEQRPHVTYRPLTTDPGYVYLHPSPLAGNVLLVARRETRGKGTWGIGCLDADAGTYRMVFDSPEQDELQAVVVAPRRRPDGHSTVVDTKFNTGLFYGLNSYDVDSRMAGHLPTGTVKQIRLIEGLPQPAASQAATPSGARAPLVARRLLGEAPVEADGSFNLEVPADIPLLLQTLDERGLALATCGWVWVKPREKRGCIGCHEDPERVPENDYVLALRRPSTPVVPAPAERRAVTFRDDVAPILQQHCATAACHGGRKGGLHIASEAPGTPPSDLVKTYATLMTPARKGPAGAVVAGRFVDAGRARTSRLVWLLAGTNTSRPWDQDARTAGQRRDRLHPMPPPGKGQPLSADELRTVIQWIDLGAPFDAPANATSPKTP